MKTGIISTTWSWFLCQWDAKVDEMSWSKLMSWSSKSPEKSLQLRINGNILGMPPGLWPQILFLLKSYIMRYSEMIRLISYGVLRTLLFIAYLWPWLMLALQRTGFSAVSTSQHPVQNFHTHKTLWSCLKLWPGWLQSLACVVHHLFIYFPPIRPLGLTVAIDKPLGWTIQHAFQEQLRLLTSERRWQSPMWLHLIKIIGFGCCRLFPWYEVHHRSAWNYRFMHPNGQLPAYEWNFNDVNPPVHAGLPRHGKYSGKYLHQFHP